MNYSTDLSIITWLEIDEERIYNSPQRRVADVLPDIFSAYTALLPAVGIIEGFPFEQINICKSTIAQINTNASIWKQYGVFSAHQTPDYKLTKFSDLAVQFGVTYDANVIKRLEWGTQGFAVKWEQTASNLLLLLRELAQCATLNLYVVDYYRYEAIEVLPSSDQVVYSVTIEEFISLLSATSFDTTLYLFPDDRSWCLINVEDGDYPILGTSRELGEALGSKSSIEMFPLSPESNV